MVIAGVLLLRLAGRKSISQMTLAQTVVMISIGSIIIQPIVETSVLRTILASSIFVVALILMEFLQVRFNFLEKFLTGKSKVIIQNGQLNVPTMRKLRFTVDQLEMRLRQQGISDIKDVKTATLEPNGQIGYELMDEAKPLTVKEFKRLMKLYDQQTDQNKHNIFSEINDQSEQHNPDHLH
ncbi:DUF421 domain-containing protein [Salinibacillus xinjiangensis]|uniref:DUF421 domain-containing protein n=1 Tax=Salinibacillus xinjiangensis TaxID=1229268 RepID=A0A6G1X4I8_9BACI|nr:DUF421 domain-containing protein [Salinibacillus xinjiangensis]MRG85839.1 DUF421 domain-containing protein [Salinibacillus xinjiangensis]